MRYRRVTVLAAVPQKLWFREVRYRRFTGALPSRPTNIVVPWDALPTRYRPVLQKLWSREVRYRRVTGALPSRPTKTMVS